MLSFTLNWQQSCLRKRNEAAEELFHYIYDGLDDPRNLTRDKTFYLLKALKSAQNKVDDWVGRTDDFLHIYRTLAAMEKNSLTLFEIVQKVVEIMAEDDFKSAIKSQLTNLTSWQAKILHSRRQ